MCAREVVGGWMPSGALLDVTHKHPSAALEVVVAGGFCSRKKMEKITKD
jgi:hypothetical protein